MVEFASGSEELSNMRHVYVRVYIDIKNSIGYIIGYITNAEFIKNLNLKKMQKTIPTDTRLTWWIFFVFIFIFLSPTNFCVSLFL